MRVRYGSGRSRTPALCPLNVCTSEPSLQLHRQTVASPEALASLCAWPTPLSGGSAWVQSTESEGGGWSRAGAPDQDRCGVAPLPIGRESHRCDSTRVSTECAMQIVRLVRLLICAHSAESDQQRRLGF